MIKQIKRIIISLLLCIALFFNVGNYNQIYGQSVGENAILNAQIGMMELSDVVESKSSIDEQINETCMPEVSANVIADIEEPEPISGWIATESDIFRTPNINASILTTYEIATEVEYEEINSDWVKIEYEGTVGYIPVENVINEKPVLENENYTGVVLNEYHGTVSGPTGKETYYNLPMEKVIFFMKKLGYDYNYWVREDGVKMYGDYIMIAANTYVYKKGTLLETSLGIGIVCDHCVAAELNINQLDIAVTW